MLYDTSDMDRGGAEEGGLQQCWKALSCAAPVSCVTFCTAWGVWLSSCRYWSSLVSFSAFLFSLLNGRKVERNTVTGQACLPVGKAWKVGNATIGVMLGL